MRFSETVLLTATDRIGIEVLDLVYLLKIVPQQRHVILRVRLRTVLKIHLLITYQFNQGETICGWAHDSEHDFDFERRTGYNNRTILMNTGPQVRHFFGYFFVF